MTHRNSTTKPVVTRGKTLKRKGRKPGPFTPEQETLRGWARSALRGRSKS